MMMVAAQTGTAAGEIAGARVAGRVRGGSGDVAAGGRAGAFDGGERAESRLRGGTGVAREAAGCA